jgi:hypothetical protein
LAVAVSARLPLSLAASVRERARQGRGPRQRYRAQRTGFTYRHVQVGSTVHTDESGIYSRVGGLLYTHETINHGAGEYVRGNVTTNGIESVFALLKRGMHRRLSPRLAEAPAPLRWRVRFPAQRGRREEPHAGPARPACSAAAIGQRLTYKELIA